MITSVYEKLNGAEMPMSLAQNPLLKKKASYLDKQYRDMIIEMNKSIKQLRHRSAE